ncbi:MAG TPA: hypothetical protein VF089_04935, partial [Candidatus Binatia bacterium]
YEVRVSGGYGDISQYSITQSPGQADHALQYLFETDSSARSYSPYKSLKDFSNQGKIFYEPLRKRMKPTAPRYVNINIVGGKKHTLIPQTQSLEANRMYYVRINIGTLSPDTAVENPKPFPAQLLPIAKGGHWLETVVVSDDFKFEKHRYRFFLPNRGASWVCTCPPHDPHTCDDRTRENYLYIPTRPIKEIPEARLRIGIYYGNNLIQSQLLTAVIGETERESRGYSSKIDYTLTANVNNLASFTPRTLNILTNQNADGTHRIVINGELDDAVTFNLTEGKVGNAIGAVRHKLLELHMRRYGGQLGSKPQFENLYDNNNAKSKVDFLDDLKQLAPCGRLLWELLLTDQPERRRKLRNEILRNPSTIQVSRVQGSNFVFPWGVVYDIPLESDSEQHRPCRLLDEWEQAGVLIDAVQPHCPYDNSHGKNTICPFGFWGFKHIIEQPPSMPDGRDLQIAINVANRPIELLVALSLDLDQSLSKTHIEALETDLVNIMKVVPCRSRRNIEAALAQPKLELVYFYCHGERQAVSGSNVPVPFLEIGHQEKLTTGDIISWSDSDWDKHHWLDTSPLVFINGCHTAELTPQILVNFVDAFTGVFAAGVIGTEIMLHQRVANEAGQIFFDYFKNPKCSVGEALQQVRRSLLLKGNLLGLAYTAYCSADLQLST